MIISLNKSIVLRLIEKATKDKDKKGIMGKKALQKSIYFFNLSHNKFYFRWADYGPFSGEIQQIFHDLKYENKINVQDVATQREGIMIRKMTFVKDHSELKDFPQDLDATLDKIIKFTVGRGPRELELFASVHFLAETQKEREGKCNAKYIHKKLSTLKPEAGFTKSDVENAIQILKDNSFLIA